MFKTRQEFEEALVKAVGADLEKSRKPDSGPADSKASMYSDKEVDHALDFHDRHESVANEHLKLFRNANPQMAYKEVHANERSSELYGQSAAHHLKTGKALKFEAGHEDSKQQHRIRNMNADNVPSLAGPKGKLP